MAVSSKTGLSTAYVLTTALSERIVDAVTLVLISSFVLLFLPSRPGWFEQATRVFVPLGLGGASRDHFNSAPRKTLARPSCENACSPGPPREAQWHPGPGDERRSGAPQSLPAFSPFFS